MKTIGEKRVQKGPPKLWGIFLILAGGLYHINYCLCGISSDVSTLMPIVNKSPFSQFSPHYIPGIPNESRPPGEL